MAAGATERVILASPTTGRGGNVLSSPWLFTGEDNLRIVVVNSSVGVVLGIDGRFIETSAPSTPRPINETMAVTSDRTVNVKDVSLGNGFLLNLSVVILSGTALIGQTYVMVQVIRGLGGATMVLGCLLGGYVTAVQHLAYPGSPILSSTDGEPAIRRLQGSSPPPGGELNDVVPTGARWELISYCAALATSAVAGNRWASLQWMNGGQKYGGAMMQSFIIPSNGRTCTWAPGMVAQTAVNNPDMSVALPSRLLLLGGFSVRTVTQNLDAADQWTPPLLLYREWLEVA